MNKIVTIDLKKMKDCEGLILQGCGGDLQEWVNGINEQLTKENILLDGSKFSNVSAFEHDGLTNEWQKHSYIALCCVGDAALLYQLKENPHLYSICLCLDNDEAGQKANKRIREHLTDLKYSNITVLKSHNKDWNEDLKELNGMIPIPSEFEEMEETQCRMEM